MSILYIPENKHRVLSSPGETVYLQRPQIDRLLEKALDAPVVTIIAGAGYGKTRAVYSHVHNNRRYKHIIWIPLSERDNIGELFWENYTAAVSVHFKETSVNLDAISFPSTERQFDLYFRIPMRDIIRGEKYIFVFDDIHLVRDTKVLGFIERSITSPFPNITSVLIGRSDPRINLMQFEAKGLIKKISQEALQFSKEELREYFRLQDIALSGEMAETLYRHTQGWVFALSLAARAFKTGPGGAGIALQTMRCNIFKLIESEVVAGISPALRKFLIKLSFLEQHPADLLRLLDGSLLAELDAAGSLIHLDSYTNTYMIHTLLMEYFSGLQDELASEEKKAALDLAARWHLEHNQKTIAIRYFEKAGDYQGIINSLYSGVSMVMPEPLARMILDILNRAPPQIFTALPLLHILRAWVYICLQMLDHAEAESREVIAILQNLAEFNDKAAGGRNYLAGLARGNGEGAAGKVDPFLIILKALAYARLILGFTGFIRCTVTRDYEFVEEFKYAARYAARCGFPIKSAVSVQSLCVYLCRVSSPEKGEIERFIQAVERMTPYLSGILEGCGSGMADLAWGELAYFRGDLALAEEFILKAIKKAKQKEQYEIESRAFFYLLRVYLNRGEYEKIRTIRGQIAVEIEKAGFVNQRIYFDITSGWFYAQIGQPVRMATWLKNEFEESELNSIVYGLELLVKAKYHYAVREYPATLAALKSGDERYGPAAYVMGKIEIMVLEAACYYKMGKKEACFACLAEAWALAEPNGFIMPFIEMNRDMRSMAMAAEEWGKTPIPKKDLERMRLLASAYTKRLSNVAKNYFPAGEKEPGEDACSLSRRELEVLQSLFQGLTGEEIAQEMRLSINTIKSIIKRIYYKLGALNRSDAIRIAVGLGLLKK